MLHYCWLAVPAASCLLVSQQDVEHMVQSACSHACCFKINSMLTSVPLPSQTD